MQEQDASGDRPRRAAHAAHRVVDGEAVLVDTASARIQVLNDTGTLVWQMCDGEHTVDRMVERLCTEFDVDRKTAESHVLAFLGELRQKNLVE